MKRTSHGLALGLALLAGLALALAACDGGQPTPSGSVPGSEAPASPSPAAPAESQAAVAAAKSSLGQTLVDAEGRTLYAFTKDKGGKSACYGDCEATWPALTIQGKIASSGYRYTVSPTDPSKLDADDLLQGGPAVSIEGSVGQGIILAIPPKDSSTTDPDEDDDGIKDAEEGNAQIASFGVPVGIGLYLPATISAIMVILIHCYYGYTASGGPAGVGTAVGRAIRTSIVWIVVADFFLSFAIWGSTTTVRITG